QATDAAGHGATACLGRVCGEDRVEAQFGQTLARLLVADLASQLRERGRHGVGRVLPARLPCPLAQHAHPLVLLREVDEVEVTGERAGDLIRTLDGERV